MEIIKETTDVKLLKYGHTAVGLSPVQLCNSFTTRRGILLQADRGNSWAVYIGIGPFVQANNSEAGGLPLQPGHSIVIPIDDPSALYVVSADTDQDVAWFGV